MTAALSVPKFYIEGDPAHFPAVASTTPGVVQVLISTVVPVNFSRDIWQFVISCAFSGHFTIDINGTVIGSGRTGAGEQNVPFSWTPPQSASAGQTITVKFTARDGAPPTSVEAFLMCADIQIG